MEKENKVWMTVQTICAKENQEFYRRNKKLLNQINYSKVRFCYLILFFMCGFYFIVSLFNPALQIMRIFLGIGCLIGAAGEVMMLTIVWKRKKLVVLAFYGLVLAMLIVGIGVAVNGQRSYFSISFFVGILAAVLLYIGPTIYSIILLFASEGCLLFLPTIVTDGKLHMQLEMLAEGLVFFILAVMLIFYINHLQITNLLIQQKYQKSSGLDSLTSVFNKCSAEKACKTYLTAKPRDEICVLMLVDIDELKEINDSCGQSMGDNALRTMGQILKSIFRERDIIGRTGEDEFLICMCAVRDEAVVAKRANEIIARYRQKTHELGIENSSCSIGVCIAGQKSRRFRDILCCAQEALSEVKQQGRGTVLIHESLK